MTDIIKKVNISCVTFDSYEKIVKVCEEIGIEILEKAYVIQFSRYDVRTKMNHEQCCKVWDFIYSCLNDAFLWKGE